MTDEALADVPLDAPPAPTTQTFKFAGPDGKVYSVEAPQGATADQAFTFLRKNNPDVDIAANQAALKAKGKSFLEGTASFGTGLVRGGVAAGMAPLDISNTIRAQLSPDAPRTMGTEDVLPWLQNQLNLYQPKTRAQSDIAAAGAAVPAALSRNPGIIGGAMAGGVVGNELASGIPNGVTGVPWLDRAMATVGVPALQLGAQAAGPALGWALHAIGAPKLGHLLDTIKKISPERSMLSPEPQPPLMTPQEIYERVQKEGVTPEIQAAADANVKRMFDYSKMRTLSDIAPKLLDNPITTLAKMLLVTPEIQQKANAGPVTE